MRKLNLIFFAILLFAGCKKSDVKQVNDQTTSLEKNAVSDAKAWFSKTIINSSVASGANQRQRLEKTPNWANSRLIYRGDQLLISVPLQYKNNVSFTPYQGAARISLAEHTELLLSKESTGYNAKVVTYIPDKNSNEGLSGKFTGIILVEDWSGYTLEKFLVTKDQKYRFTANLNRGNNRLLSEDCYTIHWYVCDVIDGVYTNCQFLMSEIIGCNEGLDPCLENCTNYDEYMGTIITETSLGVQMNYSGSQQVDPTTGMISQNVGYEWQCGVGSTRAFGFWYNWIYKSYEVGVIEKQNWNDPWLFQSLTHSGLQRIGITPPTHAYTESLGSAYSVTALDRRTSRMYVNFVVYETIIMTNQTKSWPKSSSMVCAAPSFITKCS